MAVFRIPVTLTWTGSGSPGVNVFHLRTTESSGTPGNSLIIEDGLDVLQTFITAVYNQVGAAGLTWSMGESITDVVTQEDMSQAARTGTGGGSGNLAPPALAVCVSWKTSLAARRGRGRTFIGPLTAGCMDSTGTPLNSDLTALRTAVSNFVTASNAIAGGSFAVYGQESPLLPDAKVARDITSGSIRDQFAVLRSRRD